MSILHNFLTEYSQKDRFYVKFDKSFFLYIKLSRLVVNSMNYESHIANILKMAKCIHHVTHISNLIQINKKVSRVERYISLED